MNDPYSILGVAEDADDATIRGRYLALVKAHPPEQEPEVFAKLRAAYEAVKDLDSRVKHRLFPQPTDSIEAILAEYSKRQPRPRPRLEQLITVATGAK